MIQISQIPTGKLASLLMKYVNDYALVSELLYLWEDFRVKKNTFLVEEGEMCDYVYFLEEGAIKKFFVSDKGEHVTCISLEVSFVTAFHSFLSHQPSLISLKTIEDCKLKRVSKQNWNLMSERFPKMDHSIRHIMEQYYCGLERHIINLQKTTAKERFTALMKQNPSIFNRIRLKDIASYLNMTPSTLSRIRASQLV